MAVTGMDVLGVASGGLGLAAGALLLRVSRARGPGMLLGMYAVLVSCQVVLARLSLAMDGAASATLLQRASEAFLIPSYVFLLHFAATFPTRLPVADKPWWIPALLLPALGAVALLPVGGAGGGQGSIWGWAPLVLILPAFLAAHLLAWLRFAGSLVAAGHDAQRAPFHTAALGLSCFVSYYVPYLAIPVLTQPEALLPRWGPVTVGLVATYAAASLVVWSVASVALLWKAPGRVRATLGAAIAVPALSAVAANAVEGWDLLGLWRVAAIGLLLVAVARWRLLDLELRLRSWAYPAATAVIAVVLFGALATGAWLAAGTSLSEDLGLASGLALAAAGAALAAHPRVRAGLDAVLPQIRASEESALRRRLEIYRAALAGPWPEAELAALRRELRLAPAEQRAVELQATPRDAARPPADALGGRYAPLQVLRDGLHGRILLARDGMLGGTVVLKEYCGFAGGASVDAFLREAKTLGDLSHPNILQVRDVVRRGDDLFLVLEHATGGSLEDRLAREPPDPQAALAIAEQVAAGLAHAHRSGIVHRDVKPSNVLFQGGQAKVADFGIATDPVLERALRTLRGQPGTPGWMAPEQARGDGATPASDVHALGAVLYRMLAGRHYIALEGLDEQGVRAAILHRAPDLPLPGVPAEVNALLAKALAKDPAARYPDAGAALRELQITRAKLALRGLFHAGPPSDDPSPAAGA